MISQGGTCTATASGDVVRVLVAKMVQRVTAQLFDMLCTSATDE